jgi:integrase
MRRPAKTLTAQYVRNAKDPGKHFDGNGLFLRIDKAGGRYWVQRITIQGKRREIGIGSPELVTLAEARESALVNRRLVQAGGDPLQAKREARAMLTFEEAARKVYEIHKPSWSNAKHAAQFISTLESYTFPKMGRIRVADVTAADILEALQPIWLTKPETARRVRQRIGMVMKWAIAQGWRLDNPADAIAQALPKQTKPKKPRKALPYQEVAGFLETLQSSQAGAITKLALELVVLTACRSGDVRLALWQEIDLDKAEWIIPPDRMKAKREHRIPLSGRAVDVLQQVRALGDGSGLVFPSTRYGKPLSDMTLSKLVKGMGFDVDVHGFRTSFKTWAQEKTNSPREVSEAALAHTVKDKAEAAYARSDLFAKRRKLMERWAGYVTAKRGDVVRIG